MSLSASSAEDFVARCLQQQRALLHLDGYQVDHLPGGRVLIVSFEPATVGKQELDLDRPAWCQALVQRRGHTLLGVKRERTDWYRGADLHSLFRLLQARGFFQGFSRVMFYGASMGGYAALTFAVVSPGCIVLAMNPQSTLAPDIVWFDQRFADARASVWQGDFVDGVDGAKAAAKLYVCYDPYQVKDRLHVERLPRSNRVNLRLPFVGHNTPHALRQLGLLSRVFDGALDGAIDEGAFRALARARGQLADYHARLADHGMYLPRRLRCLARARDIDPHNAEGARIAKVLAAPVKPSSEVRPFSPTPVPGSPLPSSPWTAGIVVAQRVPLIYVRVPHAADSAIQSMLLFMARGRCALDPGRIGSDEDLICCGIDDEAGRRVVERCLADKAFVFTFVRDPARRAYACFTKIIAAQGPGGLGLRSELMNRWGLSPAAPDEPLTVELHRERFSRFLHFVQANLAGRTAVQKDMQWAPQSQILRARGGDLKIALIGRVESFRSDMAQVLHRAKVKRIPDLTKRPCRPPAPAFAFEHAVTPTIEDQIRSIYALDYAQFGYVVPGASAPCK